MKAVSPDDSPQLPRICMYMQVREEDGGVRPARVFFFESMLIGVRRNGRPPTRRRLNMLMESAIIVAEIRTIGSERLVGYEEKDQ